ncbi:MerR family transcriptional regulator [Micromonospora sp. NPDC002389]|uniref:MerR family transcriptional regulator n=1 Tax=Micromonospora sp. NPDC002389 TaxID=3154272 RepID=UPI003322FE0B
MNDDLTAGEFQVMTGLSAKALRLYAERGILTPASVDPRSGYRQYARSQVRHGIMADLLRRAQVPLSELGEAADFPFAQWRDKVMMRRSFEDFFLAVAEHIAECDPADLTAHRQAAPSLEWVGVILDLDIPDDVEGTIGRMSEMAAVTPEIDQAFGAALADLAVPPADLCWSAAPQSAGAGAGAAGMLLARPGPVGLDEASRDLIEERVRARTGESVRVVTGTLPPRLEITFTATAAGDLSPVEEAAAGYRHLLAFGEYTTRHGLTALSPMPREVSHGPSLFSDDPAHRPVSVFDARA